jgi:hypothetical protein
MSLESLRFLNTIHSDFSTLRSKLVFGSRRLNVPPIVPLPPVNIFTWTLDSCVHLNRTILALTNAPDEASYYMWVFLTSSKDPPIDIIDQFLRKFGHKDGGSIRTDQGGELAGSSALSDMILSNHLYVYEPTGADSPSQNGATEIYNDKLAVRTRTLLYGAGLPANFWSSALLHAVYLHNRLVHSTTKHTPFESYFGTKPDLTGLKMFGSWVCMKRTGHWPSKLVRHDFTGIFIGYSALDHNITYIDLDSGLVKSSHHAQFDKAWYLQES